MAFNRPVTSWTAIVPIRSLREGKTRLQGYPDAAVLTEAFARDVIAACAHCPAIESTMVVSPEPAVIELARDLGCRGVLQTGQEGINPAIEQARSELPEDAAAVAILGDTPCLDGDTLTTVLAQAEAHAVSFVPDTAGTGTTIWATRERAAAPHFGTHSRARHRQAGAVELGTGNATTAWARARRDVDTAVDLWDARRLGVGPATNALLG